MQRAIWIMWPSFLTAGLMTMLFFSLLDPAGLVVFGIALADYRMATYSGGFFMFWAFSASDSWLTLFLQRSARSLNRPRTRHTQQRGITPSH